MACALIIILTVCLAGCSLFDWNTDIDDGFDRDEVIATEYDFTITASLDTITVSASSIGEYGNQAKLVALPPYKYLYTETVHGLSQNIDEKPIVIDSYDCGTSAVISFERYVDDVDYSYYKYFFVDDANNVLAGPMYCTEIQPLYTHESPIDSPGIKGVTSEDVQAYEVMDLGCTSTALNMLTERLVVPNELDHNGEWIELEYTESIDAQGNLMVERVGSGLVERVEKVQHNGKTYYMRLDEVEYFDKTIRFYTQNNVRVTLILLQRNIQNALIQPSALLYPNTENANTFVQINTSNELGAGYWGAIMEFLANRYSQSDNRETAKYGVVESYVLGNEIDLSGSWNAIVPVDHPPLDLEDYVEEYERIMRIGNTAIKKYYGGNKVLASITHHWCSKGGEYAPKDILDSMTKKTIRQGNYDYGFAVHPYGADLQLPNFWAVDPYYWEMSGNLNTSKITWSNLEVLQLYLEQPSKLCNGEIRSVYLTEGGVSSGSATDSVAQQQQCAGIAYAYYKASQLSCVKAFIYFRLIDNRRDGTQFGLIRSDGILKESYNLYKFIDTQYTDQVAAPYLRLISWNSKENGQSIPHGQDIGNVQSYFDTMALFKSQFDWASHWDESKFIVRHVDEVPSI